MAPDPTSSPPASSEMQSELDDLGKGIGDVRALLQRTGAALGAAATAILGGLGYSQLHNTYPLPRDDRGWVLGLVIAGIAMAVVGAVYLGAVFFLAQRRILMDTDPERCGPRGWCEKEREKALIEEQYRSVASSWDAASLEQLELRAGRFRRISNRTPGAAIGAQADAASLAVRLAMRRAAARLVEDRSTQVLSIWTAFVLLLTATGVVLAFGAADYSKGEQNRIGLISSCGTTVVSTQDSYCPSTAPTKTTTQSSTTTVTSGGTASTTESTTTSTGP